MGPGPRYFVFMVDILTSSELNKSAFLFKSHIQRMTPGYALVLSMKLIIAPASSVCV